MKRIFAKLKKPDISYSFLFQYCHCCIYIIDCMFTVHSVCMYMYMYMENEKKTI